MGFFDKPQTIGPGSGSDADRSRIADLEARVARLEAQLAHVDQLMLLMESAQTGGQDAFAPAPPAAWMAEVQALRRDGKTIHAIKLYREHTGVGLKQAKDAVEAMPG